MSLLRVALYARVSSEQFFDAVKEAVRVAKARWRVEQDYREFFGRRHNCLLFVRIALLKQ